MLQPSAHEAVPSILLVLRLYSALEQSLEQGHWRPRGVPTIYKLIEALARSNFRVSLVLTDKRPPAAAARGPSRRVHFDNLSIRTWLIPGFPCLRQHLGRMYWPLTELRHALAAIWATIVRRPDLVYVDRGNLWAAGLIARFLRRPVVYRVMGVSPAMLSVVDGTTLGARLQRWLLRSPFTLVLCTQDGSGGEFFLQRALRPSANVTLLLNGVDPVKESVRPTWPADRTVVLFLGRLETIKGAEEFVQAFLRARSMRPSSLHAVVVGRGHCETAMKQQVAEANALEDVTFTSDLGHAEAQAIFSLADIYVSLNRQGNLSNANLEAFRSGCCVIAPASDMVTGRDVETDRLFPADTALRVSSATDVEEIAAAIVYLADNPDERASRQERTRTVAEREIPSWDERIATELSLLAGILKRNASSGAREA